MNFADYLKAKQDVVNAAVSLDIVDESQADEREEIQRCLSELDTSRNPVHEQHVAAKYRLNDICSRLLDPWECKHKYRYPEATIYTHGNIGFWWGRKAWLRVVGGSSLQWVADWDSWLGARASIVFGPPSSEREAIIAEFDKHLTQVTELLEESGWIIVPKSVVV